MGEPGGVFKTKLDFLVNIARKAIRIDPTGVDVEGRFAPVRIGVFDPQLDAVPGVSLRGTGNPALAGRAYPFKFPILSGGDAKGEIDQFDIMDRDIGSRVPTRNPLGKLVAADLPGLEECRVAASDRAHGSIVNQCPEPLMVWVQKLVVNNPGQAMVLEGQFLKLIEFLEGKHRGLFNQDVFSGLKCRFGQLKMAVVGGGDHQCIQAIQAGKGGAVGRMVAWISKVLAVFGQDHGPSGACPAVKVVQLAGDRPGAGDPDGLSGQLKEYRKIGFLKDHPQAGHAEM